MGDADRGQDDDTDQRRWDRGGEPGHQIDDGEAEADHGIGLPAHPQHLRHLRREDQDGERIDESSAHRARYEAHHHIELEQPEDDLQHAGQQRGRQQILQAMRMDQRRSHQRDRPGRARDHRRPSPGDRNDDADHEGGEQPDLRIDAGNEREGDNFGNKREGADHAGQHIAAGIGSAAEPFGTVAGEGMAHEIEIRMCTRERDLRIGREALSGGSAAGIATRNCTGSMRMLRALKRISPHRNRFGT